jgi:hypothetical protein
VIARDRVIGAQAGIGAFSFLSRVLAFRDNARRDLRKEGTMITLLIVAAATWIGGAGLGV